MNKRILLVDDDLNVLNAYIRNLRTKYEITTATSGEIGLRTIKTSEPFSVILSDYRMPAMDGVEFLSKVKDLSPDTVRIMLTGYADINTAINSINEGHVFRFLTKPCQNEFLVKAINDGIEQHRLITSEKELFEKTLRGTIKILIDILSIVNPLAFSRAVRLRNIVKKLGNNFDDTVKWKLEITALLSQIGCVTLPTEILEKRVNNITLSYKEKELYLAHPQFGKSLLENIPRLEEIAEAIAYQYKRYNSGSEDKDSNNVVNVLARTLKHAIDIDTLIESQKNDALAIEHMKKKDDFTFDQGELELSDLEKNYTPKRLYINNLQPGMILQQDIIDKNGLSLVGKGTEISEALIMRLSSFVSLKRIVEPIRVYALKETA